MYEATSKDVNKLTEKNEINQEPLRFQLSYHITYKDYIFC